MSFSYSISLIYFLTLLLELPSAVAQVPFDTNLVRGERTANYVYPATGYAEQCIIIHTIPGVDKKASQIDIENQLCSFNFHAEDSGIGLCPKLSSTNPGLEVYTLDIDVLPDDFRNHQCQKESGREGGDKVAKIKSNLTCAYAPAILAYDQLSRYLETTVIIPRAVIRTIDRSFHQELRRWTLDNHPDRSSQNYRFWRSTWGMAYQDEDSSHGDMAFTLDNRGVFGVMYEHPKKNYYYHEINGPVNGYDLRIQSFKSTRSFGALMDERSIQQIISANPFERVAELVRLREMSDLMILDHILGQVDRPGNINYSPYWYFVENNKIERRYAQISHSEILDNIVRNDKQDERLHLDETEAQNMRSRGAFLVKTLVSDDNECAVTKGNDSRRYELLSSLSHISPITYRKVIALSAYVQSNEFLNYATQDWAMSETDVSVIRSNYSHLIGILQSRCRTGKLKMDLDLRAELLGEVLASPACD